MTPEVARPAEEAIRKEDLLRGVETTAPRPVLDADGLLRHGGRWVAIPDRQIDVLRILLDRLGRVVSLDALRAAYQASGGSGHPSSMRTLVARLGRRVARVDLSLVTIRGRGVLLAAGSSGRGPASATG